MSKPLIHRRNFLLLTAGILAGCQRVEENPPPPPAIHNEEPDYIVALVVDMSGSFAGMMERGDGKAYQFLMMILDRYHRERIGESDNDRLIVSQISATTKVNLIDCQTRQLRTLYGSADDFNDFLLKHSNPGGSRCYQGLAEALEYLMSRPGVLDGRTRTAVFCLSDMLDNAPDGPQQKDRLKRLLAQYARTKSVLGLYWVDADLFGWHQAMKDAGFKNFVVESSIVAQPTIPRFTAD